MRNIFTPADILLPRSADMTKWAVIACDQFSSEPEYWDRVASAVGDSPSTLHLMLPEAYLEKTDMNAKAAQIAETMERYLMSDVFYTLPDSFVYVERKLRGGKTRRGLVGKLDLESYDFAEGSSALVRASENTDVLRLPPRIRMRAGGSVETPHIMLLADDPHDTLLAPLSDKRDCLQIVYDFDLMERGGHITGYRVHSGDSEAAMSALGLLKSGGLQMIVGDGNHSLAAAKAVWESVKPSLSPEEWERHPMRYALAELTNIYDASLEIEPIHRVVFTDKPQLLKSKTAEWSVAVRNETVGGRIGAFQSFLEDYVGENGGRIDYIHGEQALMSLSQEPRTACFPMESIEKSELFKTVRAGGVFPKKSFSMGNAEDKRYYLECGRLR